MAPRLYLVTPVRGDAAALAATLPPLFARFDIACLRLATAGLDEDAIAQAAGALLPVCAGADVALVITEHFRLVRPLGIDGVHLTGGARAVREARRALGASAIVGAAADASRHDAMNAAEAGADYVSLGPVTPSGLGDGHVAGIELFEWWSQMIEVPVVAEGGIDPDIAARLAPFADFLALGDEIWTAPDGPEAALAAIAARLA